MNRRLAVALLLLALAASSVRAQSRGPSTDPRAPQPFTTIADTLPPPPGVPNLAWLASLEVRDAGRPVVLPDSLRRAFMAAFRGAFAEGAYATELIRDGAPVASLPASARFRLLEGTGGEGLWDVRIVLEELPHRVGAEPPGLRVTVAALPPRADTAARPVSARATLLIADLEAPGGGHAGPSRTPVQRWRIAGRATGLLALEHLHHLSGDLDPEVRLVLGPAVRVGEEDDSIPPPRPVMRPRRGPRPPTR